MSDHRVGQVTEPAWQRGAIWLWLLATLVVTGYILALLVVWCIVGITRADSIIYVAFLALLAASPFIVFKSILVALQPWGDRVGRALVAATVTAPVGLVALVVRAAMGGGR